MTISSSSFCSFLMSSSCFSNQTLYLAALEDVYRWTWRGGLRLPLGSSGKVLDWVIEFNQWGSDLEWAAGCLQIFLWHVLELFFHVHLEEPKSTCECPFCQTNSMFLSYSNEDAITCNYNMCSFVLHTIYEFTRSCVHVVIPGSAWAVKQKQHWSNIPPVPNPGFHRSSIPAFLDS